MENAEGVTNKIKIILKGSIISLVATMIILLIFSMILTYTTISESTIYPVILVTTFISILLGSSLANFKMKKNGLFNGGVIGVIYIGIIYIISSVITVDFSINLNSIIMIVLGIVSGLLGGIVGVNLKSK